MAIFKLFGMYTDTIPIKNSTKHLLDTDFLKCICQIIFPEPSIINNSYET